MPQTESQLAIPAPLDAADDGEQSEDNEPAQPPAYGTMDVSPPPYERLPTYKASICNAEDAIVIYPRFYPDTSRVQLSPVEIALLRRGHRVPILVALPPPPDKRKGMTAMLRLVLHRSIRVRYAYVNRKNIDDYGWWRGEGSDS